MICFWSNLWHDKIISYVQKPLSRIEGEHGQMFPLQQMNVKTNVSLQKAKHIFWAEGAFKFASEGIWVSSLEL